ncbi:MAG: alpha/beta fold hydrolase [Alphaproteobacteria bacterium]|nr:alpha/beta fold hydrolase [Alphaproteobacteria bacterium]
MANRIPLILGPGLMNTPRLWEHQTVHLADIADIGIVDTRQDTSLAAMAQRMLDSAPPTFAYAGLSMGGYMAFEMMRMAPERVVKLALLDTAAYNDTSERRAVRRDMIALAEKGDFETVKRNTMPIFLSPQRLQDREIVGIATGMCDEVGPQVFVQQMTAIMQRRDSRDTLRDIRVPTLVICGRQDQGTPLAASEEIAAGIPGSRLAVVEDCGHLSTIEQPQAVTALLRDWLLYG